MSETKNPEIVNRIDLVIGDLEKAIAEFKNMRLVLSQIDISHLGSALATPYEVRNELVVLRNQRFPLRSNLDILHELVKKYKR